MSQEYLVFHYNSHGFETQVMNEPGLVNFLIKPPRRFAVFEIIIPHHCEQTPHAYLVAHRGGSAEYPESRVFNPLKVTLNFYDTMRILEKNENLYDDEGELIAPSTLEVFGLVRHSTRGKSQMPLPGLVALLKKN